MFPDRAFDTRFVQVAVRHPGDDLTQGMGGHVDPDAFVVGVFIADPF